MLQTMDLIKDVMGAALKLPRWVFVWVNFLGAVNMVPYVWVFFDPHPIIIAAVVASTVAFVPNLVLIARTRGVGKAMSISHLVGWVPLCVYLGAWLTSDVWGGPITKQEGLLYYFAWTLLVTNLITVLFDTYDTLRFFRGDREVVRSDAGERNYQAARS